MSTGPTMGAACPSGCAEGYKGTSKSVSGWSHGKRSSSLLSSSLAWPPLCKCALKNDSRSAAGFLVAAVVLEGKLKPGRVRSTHTGVLSTLESRALGVWRLGGECVEATFAVVAVVRIA